MNSSSQCRIPVGAFYGHTLILPWQLQPDEVQPTVVNKQSAQVTWIVRVFGLITKGDHSFKGIGIIGT